MSIQFIFSGDELLTAATKVLGDNLPIIAEVLG